MFQLVVGFWWTGSWSFGFLDFDFHLHLRSYKLDFSDCVWDIRPLRWLYDRATFRPTHIYMVLYMVYTYNHDADGWNI